MDDPKFRSSYLVDEILISKVVFSVQEDKNVRLSADQFVQHVRVDLLDLAGNQERLLVRDPLQNVHLVVLVVVFDDVTNKFLIIFLS